MPTSARLDEAKNMEKEIKRAKCINYILFGLFAAMLVGMIVFGVVRHYQHSFSTERWLRLPEKRTRIVDDLLTDHTLVGMTEEEVTDLLGMHNNDYGYFNREHRYVYYLGPERGFFSIDSEWLVLDFVNGRVTDCYIKVD